jgi:hypothetical protein
MSVASKFAEEAARNLAGFEFKNIASDSRGPGDTSEIWRCQKPGSLNDSFDICVTKRGIAVFGDIDGLLFQAGYGLKFLAGDNIATIHGKLEAQCKEVEFDEDLFSDLVAGYIEDGIESAGLPVPVVGPEVSGAALLAWWRERGLGAVDTVGAKYSQLDALQKVRDFAADAARVSNIHEARNFFDERSGDGELADSAWYESPIESPSPSLLLRLNMVNQAAKAIVAMTLADEAGATSTAAASSTPARRPRP